ncbi:hypothetical protein BFJ71_g233 [Fusarium oxysporum]|nr:hypothetical protein BFJ71_g233 [Fusarium oxysporum]
MRDIYSQAELINAWLGVIDSPESARVVDMISTMAAGSWPRTMRIDEPLDDEELQSLGLPPQYSPTCWTSHIFPESGSYKRSPLLNLIGSSGARSPSRGIFFTALLLAGYWRTVP